MALAGRSPLVATPLALVALRALGGRHDPRPARTTLAGVALVLAGWLVLLGAPLLADAGALGAKVGRGALERATLLGASELLLGTPSVALRVAGAAARSPAPSCSCAAHRASRRGSPSPPQHSSRHSS